MDAGAPEFVKPRVGEYGRDQVNPNGMESF